MRDLSNGYHARAKAFAEARSDAGVEVVQTWAESLTKGAEVLDVGAGTGWPVTQALLEAGLEVWAIDAAPAMVERLEALPLRGVACEAVEMSGLFGRRFDGIVAVGLIFLVEESAQAEVLARMASALRSGGRLLFTAPVEVGEWEDVLTGRRSVSLGQEAYVRHIEATGLVLDGSLRDAGGNHYYSARREL